MGGPGEALGRGGAGQRAGAAASAFHGGGARVVSAGNQKEEAMADETLPRPGRRALLLGTAGAAALAMPAISYGQSDTIRIGHLTPRTGFLGPLGEFAVQAVQLAAEEINAAGGVLGRKIELLTEDSVNPQTASSK